MVAESGVARKGVVVVHASSKAPDKTRVGRSIDSAKKKESPENISTAEIC